MIELVRVRIVQSVLILRLVQPGADRDVLRGLHVERDALDLGELRLQASDDLVGAHVALVARLQRDE